MSLLDVRDLHVTFPTEDGLVRAVSGLSFSLDAGRTLGIVGESGCGKSVSTQTILGLTRGAQISGEAVFEGRDLLAMRPEELRTVRGAKIAMIFQDPLTSLHPHYRVGWQIVEMIQAHEPATKQAATARAVDLLRLVGIPQPQQRVDDYPHQFSGGMRQRAMIAMALALNPAILIADEPTTALDVTVQAQIVDLIERVQAEFGTAVIMITHDLGVVADMADEVLVMYAGRPVEQGARRTIYYQPHHPYTKGLLESIPSSTTSARSARLKPITGAPPSLITLPSGCAFHPRCPYVMDVCRTDVPELAVVGGDPAHRSACHLPADELGFAPAVELAREISVAQGVSAAQRKPAAAPAAKAVPVRKAAPRKAAPRKAVPRKPAPAPVAEAAPVRKPAVRKPAAPRKAVPRKAVPPAPPVDEAATAPEPVRRTRTRKATP